jgi:hypothetical protein
VAHDGVVVGDAVGAEDVAGHAGAFEGHPDVVALGHGDVFVAELCLRLSGGRRGARAAGPW